MKTCVRVTALLLLAATTVADAPGAAAGVEPQARPFAGGPRVHTLATMPGGVRAFAHDGRQLAWLTGGVEPRCTVRVWFHDLRGGGRRSLSGCTGPDHGFRAGDLLLAGGRAYWTHLSGGNTYVALELRSVAPGDRRTRSLETQSLSNELHGISTQPPVSDGRSVYFWTTINVGDAGDPGPVVRFDGTRRTRITPAVRVAALAAGGGRLAIAEHARVFDCAQEPTWSPDGQRIAFSTRVVRPWVRPCREGVWVMNADGSGQEQIAASGRNPDWSPDGQSIAFDDARAIRVIDPDGGKKRTLVAAGTDPAWSPDGRLLAFTRGSSLFVVGADGGGERRISDAATAPAWSPDGTRLVFARPATPSPGLGIVNLDGSGHATLTSGRHAKPAWSPDGRLIAYESCRGCLIEGSGLELVAPDGTGRRVLWQTDQYSDTSDPAWAPDSQRLAYAWSHLEEDQGDDHLWTQTLDVPLSGRKLTATPVKRTPLVLRAMTGHTLARIEPDGVVDDVAVTERAAAAIVRAGGAFRLEIYAPRRHAVALPRTPQPSLVGGHGTTLVLRLSREIHAVDARTGRRRLLARTLAPPIGLSVVGHRVAWAENRGGRAYVRAVAVGP